MDSRDEELTLKNVDELVAQELTQLQASQSEPTTSLSRAVRDLHLIYEEQRRLEQVWERINARVAASPRENNESEETVPPLSFPAQASQDEKDLAVERAPLQLRKLESGKRARGLPRWRKMGIALVAALALLTLCATFLVWPLLAPRFQVSQTGGLSTPTGTASPQSQLVMKEYAGRYFKIRYPADWVITGVTAESTASYVQTVQFRPSSTSLVEISVSVMPDSNLSIYQLLARDPQVRLGTLENTRSLTAHSISWAVDIVQRKSASPAQASKLEIAYSKPTNPYRIEFAATSQTFDRYAPVFDAMLASLVPQTPQAQPTNTPTSTASSVATATPFPTENVPALKIYACQYFKLQYPTGWVVTSVTQGGTSLQTVQLRPSATSAVFVNIEAMDTSGLSASQLLQIDADVNLGTLISTNTVTSHGVPWSVDIVHIAGSLLALPSTLEVAYSNQHATTYKIEFSAPPDSFATYSSIFNNIFASFYAEG